MIVYFGNMFSQKENFEQSLFNLNPISKIFRNFFFFATTEYGKTQTLFSALGLKIEEQIKLTTNKRSL